MTAYARPLTPDLSPADTRRVTAWLPILTVLISATVTFIVLILSSIYGHLAKRHELLQDRLEKAVDLAFSFRAQYGGTSTSLQDFLGDIIPENADTKFTTDCESLSIKSATLVRLYFPSLASQFLEISLQGVELSKSFRIKNQEERARAISKSAFVALSLVDQLLKEIQMEQYFLTKHPPTLLIRGIKKKLNWE